MWSSETQNRVFQRRMCWREGERKEGAHGDPADGCADPHPVPVQLRDPREAHGGGQKVQLSLHRLHLLSPPPSPSPFLSTWLQRWRSVDISWKYLFSSPPPLLLLPSSSSPPFPPLIPSCHHQLLLIPSYPPLLLSSPPPLSTLGWAVRWLLR